MPGAGSAPGAGGSAGGGEGSWLTALIPRGPWPPAPGSQMLRRQQVINLDILHFFISSYLTLNEILPLTKVLLKLTLKQGQTRIGIFWGWMGEKGCKRWGQGEEKGALKEGQPGFCPSFE